MLASLLASMLLSVRVVRSAWPLLGDRVRVAHSSCSGRGRVLVAFGAHTDDQFVQDELMRIVKSAATFSCPPHDVALFVDASREYSTLNHSLTIRVPFSKLLKNGNAAFRAFVSHQLLMASVPDFVRKDKKYEAVWIVEEDSRFSGDWAHLFGAFNDSSADLVAHARKTNRGTASLMAVARVSTRLFRSVSSELDNLDARDKKLPEARPTASRKTIHGAFIYGLCQRLKWCKFQNLDKEWLAVFRAKCPWSAHMYTHLASRWPSSSAAGRPVRQGRIFHPVKVHARLSGRDFKRYRCSSQFQRENVPKFFYAPTTKTTASRLLDQYLLEHNQTTTRR